MTTKKLPKKLIEDIYKLIINTENMKFNFKVQEFMKNGFDLNDQFGDFKGEKYKANEVDSNGKPLLSWTILTHKKACVSVKITTNLIFGCKMEILKDEYEIINESILS